MGVLIFILLPVGAGDDNYTKYDTYSDMINWETVPDIKNNNIVPYYYHWDHDINKYKNAKIYNNPVTFDLPADTNLTPGAGPMQWTYLRIISPKYAVRYNNLTYTNTSDVVYEVGYLEKPSKTMTCVYIDNVTASEAEFTPEGLILVTVTCDWHTSQHSKTSGIKKIYYITTLHKSSKVTQYNKWVVADEYNETVDCVITNHSGFYNTISMTGLPTNVSYYNISVTMGNVTRYLLKSSYVYFKNETVDHQLYDMYDYDFYHLHGVSPYGKDCFLLPGGHIDDLSIVLSSPFESYELKTNITRINETKNEFDGDIYPAIMCLFVVYVLYRMLK